MIVIFAGPTIAEHEICKVIENASVMPPVSMGDVYQVAQNRPNAIGIIDGYFDSVPSVWHKEILWAVSSGIPIFGASSMGALRAAELHAFGMVGVGQIFELFRDGILEDDDEVALQHGPKELNYAPLSEPLVNIRATLKRATEEELIEKPTAFRLIQLAKDRFYPERNWENLFEDALQQGVDGYILEHLQNWLTAGAVDQKRDDALAMLYAIKRCSDTQDSNAYKQFEFQHTVMWEELGKQISYSAMPTTTSLMVDCLRSNQSEYRRYRKRAAKHLAQVDDSNIGPQEVSQKELARAMTRFRAENGLFTGAALNEWLLGQNLELDQLQHYLAEEIVMDFAISANPDEFRKGMLIELQADGYHDELKTKADGMLKSVNRTGLQRLSADELGLSSIELQLWYFETLLEIPLPDDLDYFLDKHDFMDRREFEKVMVCRFIHWQDEQRQ